VVSVLRAFAVSNNYILLLLNYYVDVLNVVVEMLIFMKN